MLRAAQSRSRPTRFEWFLGVAVVIGALAADFLIPVDPAKLTQVIQAITR